MPRSKNCQSCGMPLRREERGGGTNADGSLSETYCSHCFRDGRFTRADVTITEMQRLVARKLKDSGVPAAFAWLFTRRIPKLERWKRRETRPAKRSLFLLVLATALVTSRPAARAQTRSDQDVTEIRRLEQVWDAAHLQGDVDALDRLWAQDLEVAVPRMPLMSKSDSLRFVRTGRMTFQQYQSSDIRVRIYGTAGVVTGRLVRQRTIAGDQQLDRWRYTKVYVKQDTTWRVVAFHASEAAE